MWRLIFIESIVVFHLSSLIFGCTTPPLSNLTVQANFDINQFLGSWFEIQWLPEQPYDASNTWRNYYHTYELASSSTQFLLVTGGARLLNSDTCFSIDPWLIQTNNGAKMTLIKGEINSSTPLNWPYYVLQTDYTNYALVYGCRIGNSTYTGPCADPFLWIFSRKATLSDDYINLLDNYITAQLCVNRTIIVTTPQDGIQCYSSSNMIIPHLFLFGVLFILYI